MVGKNWAISQTKIVSNWNPQGCDICLIKGISGGTECSTIVIPCHQSQVSTLCPNRFWNDWDECYQAFIGSSHHNPDGFSCNTPPPIYRSIILCRSHLPFTQSFILPIVTNSSWATRCFSSPLLHLLPTEHSTGLGSLSCVPACLGHTQMFLKHQILNFVLSILIIKNIALLSMLYNQVRNEPLFVIFTGSFEFTVAFILWYIWLLIKFKEFGKIWNLL